MLGTNGKLYGATTFGGASNNGTIIAITQSGALTTLHNFCSFSGCAGGGNPQAGLVQASNGAFYGTIFKITANGTLTTVYNFCSAGYPCADGASPYAGPAEATDGNLYGATSTAAPTIAAHCSA